MVLAVPTDVVPAPAAAAAAAAAAEMEDVEDARLMLLSLLWRSCCCCCCDRCCKLLRLLGASLAMWGDRMVAVDLIGMDEAAMAIVCFCWFDCAWTASVKLPSGVGILVCSDVAVQVGGEVTEADEAFGGCGGLVS